MLLDQNREVDIFVGSKIGSFKHIKFHTDTTKNSKKCIENLVDIKTLKKEDSITCMRWSNDEQTEILIGRVNQQVQTYNTQEDKFTSSYTVEGTGHVIGLGRCKRKLLAALSSGIVKIWSKKEEIEVQCGKMDRMIVCRDEPTLFATGGEENDLKVWRIGEETASFTAKNLAHDWLQLRRPIWVSDLTFMPGEGGNLVAVCSRHGYVRLYDTRAQRRPVCNVDFEKMAATTISPAFDERQVLVGFGRGQLHQVDLRNSRPHKGYKGCVGALTDISIIPSKRTEERLVVSTSLDRRLRIHRWQDKKLVYEQYLTSKLSCVLVQLNNNTPLKHVPAEVKDEVKEEDDLDVLFDDMETVGDKPRKKMHPETPSLPAKKLKPSLEGSTIEVEDEDIKSEPEEEEEVEEEIKEKAIVNLLRSTERQKKKIEKKKREKKARSVFHNA